jgi:hypothetical protein
MHQVVEIRSSAWEHAGWKENDQQLATFRKQDRESHVPGIAPSCKTPSRGARTGKENLK